jgi:hypothetical protein
MTKNKRSIKNLCSDITLHIITNFILLFHLLTTSETLRQLHKKFRHVNIKTIINMINNDVAKKLLINRPSFDSTYFKYFYYVIGKSTRLLFKKADNTTKNRFLKNLKVKDEIHLD